MITKIIVTVFVMVAALLFIRQRNRQQLEQERAHQAQQAAQRRQAMLVATALVTLTLVVSAGLYYEHWQEEHRVYVVVVSNTISGSSERYEVYQRDISGRSFRTIDGLQIHLSDAERMEVRGPEAAP